MRSFFAGLALVVAALGTGGVTGCASESRAAQEASAEADQSTAARIGAHGMVLAGDAAHAVLSHIPTYAAPHDVAAGRPRRDDGERGAAPSFDEVLTVTLDGPAPSDADLSRGVIARAAGVRDIMASRAGARSTSVSLTVAALPASFTMRPLKTLSCLQGPGFFETCE